MSEPPFPAPVGMTWDAEKKRFFKAVPGSAQAAVVNAGTAAKREQIRERQERDKRLLNGYAVDSSPARTGRSEGFAYTPPLAFHRSSQRTLQALHSSLPRLASSQQSQQVVTRRHLANLRHVRTAYVGCDPDGFQFCNHQVGVRALHSSSKTGALLYFMTWNKQVTLIDVARLWPTGNSFVQLHSGLQPWSGKRGRFQLDTSAHIHQRPSFACSLYEANPDTPDCFSMDGTCMAFFSMRKRLHIEHLDTSMTGESLGRTVTPKREYSFTFTISDKWLEEGVVTLSIRALAEAGHSLTCIGHGKEACIVHSWPTPTRSDGRKAHGLAQYRFKSDVVSHDFTPDGRRLVIGFRNGKLASVDTSALHVAEVFPFAFERGVRKVEKSDTLPFKLDGAITNVRFTSETAFLAITSHGQAVMLSLTHPDRPQISYLGHVNAWTLNTPLALDVQNRVFALAGQDRKVRVWSFDDALPVTLGDDATKSIPVNIQEHTPHGVRLGDAAFVGDVSGLAFCPRYDVARSEDEQNVGFLSHGVPALAVSCGRKSIAFFE